MTASCGLRQGSYDKEAWLEAGIDSKPRLNVRTLLANILLVQQCWNVYHPMLDQHFIVFLEVMFVLDQTFVERATNIAIQQLLARGVSQQ